MSPRHLLIAFALLVSSVRLTRAQAPIDAGCPPPCSVAPAVGSGSGSSLPPAVGSGSSSGSGSAIVPVPPAGLPGDANGLPNPGQDPLLAWTEAKLARKTSWPLAVWAVLAMLGKALAYGRVALAKWPILGPITAWLSVGKRAMLIPALAAVGAAGYNVLVAGGSLTAALVASGVAIAGLTHSTTTDTSIANQKASA